jgi:hypothetical protein
MKMARKLPIVPGARVRLNHINANEFYGLFGTVVQSVIADRRYCLVELDESIEGRRDFAVPRKGVDVIELSFTEEYIRRAAREG